MICPGKGILLRHVNFAIPLNLATWNWSNYRTMCSTSDECQCILCLEKHHRRKVFLLCRGESTRVLMPPDANCSLSDSFYLGDNNRIGNMRTLRATNYSCKKTSTLFISPKLRSHRKACYCTVLWQNDFHWWRIISTARNHPQRIYADVNMSLLSPVFISIERTSKQEVLPREDKPFEHCSNCNRINFCFDSF